MAKHRIIIADTDISYVIPLQLKFVEEFFEQIDIEIITDKEYFEKLFCSPQKAEILIVSEEMYSSDLQKHNISHLFLMTEKYEDESTGELNVNRIFKYTSIKEIFNEIIGKSSLKSEAKEKESQIVVVYSAVGGAGKTTVALGMAACLTQNYKRVLYINASWLQSFQRMLGNQTVLSSHEVYSKISGNSEALYDEIKFSMRKELFTYMPPFRASLMSLGLSFSVYEKIAKSAKSSGDFDFVIVDADSEFDDEKASLIGIADKVIVVTKQNAASVYATNVLVSNMNGANTDKYIFICNDFDKDDDNALIAPDTTPKFTVSEYIEHIPHYDNLKAEELVASSGIKKASFLVL